jgi:hypothetical protein
MAQALFELDLMTPKYRQPMDYMAATVHAFGPDILKARQTLTVFV